MTSTSISFADTGVMRGTGAGNTSHALNRGHPVRLVKITAITEVPRGAPAPPKRGPAHRALHWSWSRQPERLRRHRSRWWPWAYRRSCAHCPRCRTVFPWMARLPLTVASEVRVSLTLKLGVLGKAIQMNFAFWSAKVKEAPLVSMAVTVSPGGRSNCNLANPLGIGPCSP